MHNRHNKFLEIDEHDSTFRIVERERTRKGVFHYIGEAIKFNCGIDAMKMTAVMRGYKFHHGSDLIHVYEEI